MLADVLAVLVAAQVALLAIPGTAQSITFLTGRTIKATDNTSSIYNATYETSITTQNGLEGWNSYNGNTYFWGSTDDGAYSLGDVDKYSSDKFRSLLRFDNIHRYVPINAVVTVAELSLTFVNWGDPVKLEGCFMTRPWSHLLGTAPRFLSTGWNFSRYDSATRSSVRWSQAGAWADCDPHVSISLTVPGNGAYGYVSQTIALDARKVGLWLNNGGAQNHGLLFRATNATLGLVGSTWRKEFPLLRRPALALTYSTAVGAKAPNLTYPATLGAVPRTWWVATNGHDEDNSGHVDSPFKSPAKALSEAFPGDRIYLRTGAYPGGVSIQRPRITLQSAPGNWATLSLPMNDPQNAVNVVTIRPGADYTTIQNLEITGGFYYGIMFFTSWENYYSMAERVAKGAGPNHALIQNVRIHDTGSSGVKLVMKATNNTFRYCEIYNTGARIRTNGHGIEAVQAYDVVVRDCHLHDLPGAAVHLAGGTARALLERNYVERTNFGFNLGFATDYEYMDPINNPKMYESINATARNNILTAISMAGINVWASRGAVIAHNTLWQTQQNAQNSILLNAYDHDYTPSGTISTPCADITIWANLLVRALTARKGPVLQIRTNGLDPTSQLVMAHNVYYDPAGMGLVPFQWGKGAMLEDEREGSKFVGNATGWAAHCSGKLGKPYCDVNSVEADPLLSATFAPLPCSPAAKRANRTLPNGAPPPLGLLPDDFYGRRRPTTGLLDAGAVQGSGATGTPLKVLPIVLPTGYSTRPAPYNGVPQKPVYDKQWPYTFWMTRICKDLLVDAVLGNDTQPFLYDSSYAQPFKTIQQALININQCDRILLKGGQNHVGGFGIYRPNVTITTNPADSPKRALVLCNNTGPIPCIRTGDGLYGGAALINLYGFDVRMAGNAAGSCIHLNEGAGGGTSSYWSWYLATSGRRASGWSSIRSMTLSTCGLHGVKLSTFVRNVVLQGLAVVSPKAAGIEVRGGAELQIRQNRIASAGETAIRLGGGARNVIVEKNIITNFGGRGILLGSDNTEVMYMDVDWARSQSPVDWHDSINTLVRNNIIVGGAGAGIAFYSARDAVVVHNTILRVATSMQAGILINVSPKALSPLLETAAPNTNITFKNNIVSLGGRPSANLMVEARIMQATSLNRVLNGTLPTAANTTASCPLGHHHHHHHHRRRRALRGLDSTSSTAPQGTLNHLLNTGSKLFDNDATVLGNNLAANPSNRGLGAGFEPERRRLAGMPFAEAYINAPGEQGRNTDGSCPLFPADNAWRMDVTSLPLHPNGDAIYRRIGAGRGLHPDFGGGEGSGATRILYGIPFITVDSRRGTPFVPIDIGSQGYPEESDLTPNAFPFPPNAPVEGAFPNCANAACNGDRHVLLIDNATCTLYETWRSFPPGVMKNTSRWQVDIVAKFNLSRNAVGRPLGWTSADAAGMAILPGLVRYDEIVRGFIDHAIRFTGPNSRAAYVPPATHFAANGYTGADAPPMGLRVRLQAGYDCTPLARAARIFCTALKTYGGIFADNGSPWYFQGEATAKWDSILDEIQQIKSISSADIEILDTGCYCIDSDCSMSECGGVPNIDPNALVVYPSITDVSQLAFGNNIYYAAGAGAEGRFMDRRLPPLAMGYNGGLAGWKSYIAGDGGSTETEPRLNATTYKPLPGSPAIGSVPRLAAAADDYYGKARPAMGDVTDAGAVVFV